MPQCFSVGPGGRLQGSIRVPGDKSISHRSIMFAAIADGTTKISGFLEGADAISTMNAFRAMGVQIEGPQDGKVVVHGVGRHGLKAPTATKGVLDCGNSGTSMRLLSGLLAGQGFEVTLTGDESLSGRPMKRVTEPLARMGAQIDSQDGKPPLTIRARSQLNAITFTTPVASAQVKSALLLAGLYAQGVTTITETAPTRDHTERMLEAFGVQVVRSGLTASVTGGVQLRAATIEVPADISSAAFFLVGASIAKGSDIVLEHVGMNPTRTGVIDILRLMGADISVLNPRTVGGEPVADLRVRSAQLRGIDVPEALVPLAIDEFPVLFIAAACAVGQTRVSGAEELRVKESDRIAVMADGMRALGFEAQATPDGMIIEGRGDQSSVFSGGTVHAHGDHRIAMAFTMAALRASHTVTIQDTINVATSFPSFVELSQASGIAVTRIDS
jgi:3-phosphoshikimate 1-carboxyvinyltransferase